MSLLQAITSIIKHRRNVAHYCFMCHEYKRGMFHDISRFSKKELIETLTYYNGRRSSVEMSIKANGYSEAWLHHKGTNDHHYQYWIDDLNHGGRAIRMPYHQTVEMLCDYLGKNKDINKKKFTYNKTFETWTDKTNPDNNMLIHESTESFITTVLESLAILEKHYQKYAGKNIMMSDGWAKKSILNEHILKELYDAITENNPDKIDNIKTRMTTV